MLPTSSQLVAAVAQFNPGRRNGFEAVSISRKPWRAQGILQDRAPLAEPGQPR